MRSGMIAKLIGVPALLALVKFRGGSTIKVPLRASKKHQLAKHIGVENLALLVRDYGGQEVFIARCRTLDRAVKAQAILDDHNAGMNNRELARKHDITIRSVINLKQFAKKLSGSD